MLTGKWLEIDKLNQITLKIGGKPVVLQCTLHQIEKYQDLIKANETKEKVAGDGVRRSALDAYDIVEIVLNPKPNEQPFPRDAILDQIDVDQASIIARTWIDRKVFAPRVEADPLLAPPAKGA